MAWTTVRRAVKERSGISEKCPRTGKQTWRLPDPARAAGGDINSADKDA
jgi:hypothetical protein